MGRLEKHLVLEAGNLRHIQQRLPSKEMDPLLASLLLTAILWLTGCANSTWSAGVSGEPDYKSPNPLIPKAEFRVGGTF